MNSAWIFQSPYFAVMGLLGAVALASAAGLGAVRDGIAALAVLILFAGISASTVRYVLLEKEGRTPTATNPEPRDEQPTGGSLTRALAHAFARKGKK